MQSPSDHSKSFPIDPEVTREELHFRRIDMRGYRRADGLFEVEGRVTDRKSYEFVPVCGGRQVPAQEPVHDMGVRLVFDENMQVHAVQTFTEAAPYAVCPEGGRALQALKGMYLTGGWSKEVRSKLGGAQSCTHLLELLMPLATVAFQTTSALRRSRPEALDAQGRPKRIDQCYAYGAGQELVRRHWPQFYRAPPRAE